MGLDMYLNAEKHVGGWKHSRPAERKQFDALAEELEMAGFIDSNSPAITAKVNVGYWRKANAIHAWFVENVQGGVDECREHSVSRKELEDLRALCKRVLDSLEMVQGKVHEGTTWHQDGRVEVRLRDGQVVAQQELAEKLLPTQSGFFFGSTDYDENYIRDLKDTIEIVDRALSMPKDWTFSYRSSW